MDSHEGSDFLQKEPCPNCGSKDNLARYTDGHGFCFGCAHYEHGDGTTRTATRGKQVSGLLEDLEYRAINSRKITEETCRHFGYTFSTIKDKPVHVAPYRDADGVIIAQHIRKANKDFPWRGEPKAAVLWGQHLWREAGKKVVITEGEIDCMSVSQQQGNKWPVVSIACGAGKPDDAGNVKKVSKYISKHVAWLENFEEVIFMFYMDEQGQASAKAGASVLSPGKAKIATLPLHDANDMLKAWRGNEIIDAIWGAKTYRPDGIVSVSDVLEKALKPAEWGLPWFFDTLTKHTFGRRFGEVYGLGAGTGIGKTDLFTQQIEYDINTLDEKVGCIYLEQPAEETVKRIAGKAAGQRFHIPDAGWTQDQLDEAARSIDGKVFFYDNFGETEWDIVRSHIRYMARSLSIRVFYLDHLTAMVYTANERGSLEQIMKEMAMLAKELDIIIHYISHLSTPEGKPHEEGGRVFLRHFKGARAIAYWSHYAFGMERDQHNEDLAKRKITTFRILKDRYTGNATGEVIYLLYDIETGQMSESATNPYDDDTPFKDETEPAEF